MQAELNSRLAAILDRHPKIVPVDGKWQVVRDGHSWVKRKTHTSEQYTMQDSDAVAWLTASMLNALPSPCTLGRSIAGKWGCTTDDFTRADHDTALDALLNFYEGAAHAG